MSNWLYIGLLTGALAVSLTGCYERTVSVAYPGIHTCTRDGWQTYKFDSEADTTLIRGGPESATIRFQDLLTGRATEIVNRSDMLDDIYTCVSENKPYQSAKAL